MNKGEVTAPTLLDLSIAFDNIDHATLPNRLSEWYGKSTSCQGWICFSSYLQNRHQSVKIKDSLSDKVTLSYGVPHGSVPGPVLFILATVCWHSWTPTQLSRGIDPMLFYCCADVEDGGPALEQYWVNASCLLGRSQMISKLESLTQC